MRVYPIKAINGKFLRRFVILPGVVVIFIAFGWTLFQPSAGTAPEGNLPGAVPHESALLKKIEEMKKNRGSGYRPRTKHLRPDGWASYTNRLFLESSPYLIQHAHNPVNWYPWGDEAFETAKRRNLPVLLSVGYSTCHWCHVMEEESYEDEEIARYLNQNYIAVKVDREERPDIDAIYMKAVQTLTGRGGWPLNVWLTPDRKPFYGGTYFPARDGDRGAGPGFLTILRKIKTVYRTQTGRVQEVSRNLTDEIRQRLSPQPGDRLPAASLMHQAAQQYGQSFDKVNGGLSGAPKFPSSLPIRFLLRYHRRTGDGEVLNIVRLTLEKMAAGGIYDQIGSGFHRYATDRQWLVPHFEKMLYDNALLIMAYLEGYQATGDDHFGRIAKEVLGYVKREMTSPDGVFYSATDADSLTPDGHREEGYFFTWTPEELDEALGPERAKIIKMYYGVGVSRIYEGRYILHTPETVSDVSAKLNLSEARLRAVIKESKDLLYRWRDRKPGPLRDEKVLTAWNALMISAHARAGLVLGDSRFTDRAIRAADFIVANLFINDRLYRSYKDNRARHEGYLDDYAFLGAAFLDLYEATQDIRWLEKAIELDRLMEKQFEDKQSGGFFMTGKNHEDLIAREKPNYDGAEPSGNSVAVLNLLRLGEFTLKDGYRRRAEKTLKAFLGSPAGNPTAMSEMLLALDFFLDSPKEIVIVAPQGEINGSEPFMQVLRKQFLPNRLLIVGTEGKEIRSHARLVPVARGKAPIGGKTTAYVCEQGSCKLPATDPELFARQLKEVRQL